MSIMRNKQRSTDVGVGLGYVFGAANTIGLTIGTVLRGSLYTLGVCIVLKLFGVI